MMGDTIRHDTIVPISRARLTNCRKPFLANLRPRDREEMAALGVTDEVALNILTQRVVVGALFPWRWMPTVVLAFHQVGPKTVEVSMLATDDWRYVSRAVIRWALRFAKPQLLAMGFDRAQCLTMEGYDEAIRFLEFMGFKREGRIVPKGSSRAFIRYAWRVQDHVPVQCAQTAARAARSAEGGFLRGRQQGAAAHGRG
jgi:hypothetical protein